MLDRISNERKNLTRLAGEFLVASRLTQRGFMVSLQWGATIGYDILVFDKVGRVAFIEVKTSASHVAKWPLQKKYAWPEHDKIDTKARFVACVDLTSKDCEPKVYMFPCLKIAAGLKYVYAGKFSNSPTFAFPLNQRPRGKSKDLEIVTLGEHIHANTYLEKYDHLGVEPLHS
jgi:hypothetical protein